MELYDSIDDKIRELLLAIENCEIDEDTGEVIGEAELWEELEKLEEVKDNDRNCDLALRTREILGEIEAMKAEIERMKERKAWIEAKREEIRNKLVEFTGGLPFKDSRVSVHFRKKEEPVWHKPVTELPFDMLKTKVEQVADMKKIRQAIKDRRPDVTEVVTLKEVKYPVVK